MRDRFFNEGGQRKRKRWIKYWIWTEDLQEQRWRNQSEIVYQKPFWKHFFTLTFSLYIYFSNDIGSPTGVCFYRLEVLIANTNNNNRIDTKTLARVVTEGHSKDECQHFNKGTARWINAYLEKMVLNYCQFQNWSLQSCK